MTAEIWFRKNWKITILNTPLWNLFTYLLSRLPRGQLLCAVQLGAKADLHPANVSRATDAMRWRMEATEMFCLHIKFVICTNQNQPLKFARQNSYLDLWSYTLYIIWEGVHLLVKLQAAGTNKQTTKMKSLTSISQGFDKCTKTKLQNNHFWGTHPDKCFCL